MAQERSLKLLVKWGKHNITLDVPESMTMRSIKAKIYSSTMVLIFSRVFILFVMKVVPEKQKLFGIKYKVSNFYAVLS